MNDASVASSVRFDPFTATPVRAALTSASRVSLICIRARPATIYGKILEACITVLSLLLLLCSLKASIEDLRDGPCNGDDYAN